MSAENPKQKPNLPLAPKTPEQGPKTLADGVKEQKEPQYSVEEASKRIDKYARFFLFQAEKLLSKLNLPKETHQAVLKKLSLKATLEANDFKETIQISPEETEINESLILGEFYQLTLLPLLKKEEIKKIILEVNREAQQTVAEKNKKSPETALETGRKISAVINAELVKLRDEIAKGLYENPTHALVVLQYRVNDKTPARTTLQTIPISWKFGDKTLSANIETRSSGFNPKERFLYIDLIRGPFEEFKRNLKSYFRSPEVKKAQQKESPESENKAKMAIAYLKEFEKIQKEIREGRYKDDEEAYQALYTRLTKIYNKTGLPKRPYSFPLPFEGKEYSVLIGPGQIAPPVEAAEALKAYFKKYGGEIGQKLNQINKLIKEHEEKNDTTLYSPKEFNPNMPLKNHLGHFLEGILKKAKSEPDRKIILEAIKRDFTLNHAYEQIKKYRKVLEITAKREKVWNPQNYKFSYEGSDFDSVKTTLADFFTCKTIAVQDTKGNWRYGKQGADRQYHDKKGRLIVKSGYLVIPGPDSMPDVSKRIGQMQLASSLKEKTAVSSEVNWDKNLNSQIENLRRESPLLSNLTTAQIKQLYPGINTFQPLIPGQDILSYLPDRNIFVLSRRSARKSTDRAVYEPIAIAEELVQPPVAIARKETGKKRA